MGRQAATCFGPDWSSAAIYRFALAQGKHVHRSHHQRSQFELCDEQTVMTQLTTLAASLSSPIVRWCALLLLCGPYLQGRFAKLLNFDGALEEMQHFGLTPPLPFAIATIVLEIAASVAILLGYYRWLAALALAGFTVVATLLANRFWAAVPAEQFAMTNSFFEHFGLVGALLLVAWYDLRAAALAGRRRASNSADTASFRQ